jgi:uncharacterized SAM-binding protein YcdF (DUF218 family)
VKKKKDFSLYFLNHSSSVKCLRDTIKNSQWTMFVILSKFIPLFFYPLGFACILLTLAVLFHGKKRISITLILVSIAILWFFSTAWTAGQLARSLEWQDLPPIEIPQAEVAVVLGGGTDAKDYPRSGVEVNGAGDRILYAAQLFKDGKVNHLLLSGGEITWLNSTSSTPAGEMAAILEELGIPRDKLWLEEQSQNTHENALFSKKILDEKGIGRILLVTSAMHMPRAVGLFAKLGVEVIPIPVDYSVTQADLTTGRQDWLGKMLGFIPSSGNLSTSTNAIKEYIGLLIYRLRGWL